MYINFPLFKNILKLEKMVNNTEKHLFFYILKMDNVYLEQIVRRLYHYIRKSYLEKNTKNNCTFKWDFRVISVREIQGTEITYIYNLQNLLNFLCQN